MVSVAQLVCKIDFKTKQGRDLHNWILKALEALEHWQWSNEDGEAAESLGLMKEAAVKISEVRDALNQIYAMPGKEQITSGSMPSEFEFIAMQQMFWNKSAASSSTNSRTSTPGFEGADFSATPDL
eukprot:3452452-Amphidinium_carterae.1